MSIINELIANVLETPYEQFDETVIEQAKDRVVDVIGCIVSGSSGPGCKPLVDLVLDWGGKQEATIFIHGGSVPAAYAAMINSVMARSYDFEPGGPYVDGKSTPAHLSGTTVPTALAISEQINASGKDFLGALILGDDMASRIIAASNLNVDSGWDTTGTANMFGSTAIAAKLYGLNEKQMLNAFGIVLNHMAGTFQNVFDGAHTFKLPQGLSSRDGIFSAILAQKGFTGVKDPLLSKNGYFSLYCQSYDLEYLTKDLGKIFYADCTIKPYPCCRSNHAAIDCALGLVRYNEIELDNIEEITVDIPPKAFEFAVGQLFKIRNVPQIDAAFSLQYTVANALVRKSVRLEHFTDEYILEPTVMDLAGKISLSTSISSDKLPESTLRIKMKYGEQLEKSVDIPKGNRVFTPLTKDEKREKFLENILFSKKFSLNQAKEALDLLEHIEDVEDMQKVISMFVP